jgi:hypothetical protein
MRFATLKILSLGAAIGTIVALGHSSSAEAAGCSNEGLRAAQGTASLALPECRAYEYVTPGDTPYISTDGEAEGSRASTNGNGLAYFTRYPAQNATGSGFRYLATRAASGWAITTMVPQDSAGTSRLFDCYQGLDFSADLSKSILADGWNPPESPEEEKSFCGESEEGLAPGAVRGNGNLYLREGGAGSPYQLLNPTPEGVVPANAFLRAYTPDQSHIAFQEEAQLTGDAPPGNDLYEWSGGQLRLVSILPSGEPVPGVLADTDGGESFQNLSPITHAMSNDGEQVYFYAEGDLYLRKNAMQPPASTGECTRLEAEKACTVEVDKKLGGTGESGGGTLWEAPTGGRRVFFSDESRLTANSKAGKEKPDLYEYNLKTGLLKNRTVTGTTEPANVRGFSGISEDGSSLYFVAGGVLSGSEPNNNGEVAQPRSSNLYLMKGDEITFIATLDREADQLSWNEGGTGIVQTAISPDGRYLAFNSVLGLTEAASTPPVRQLFLFDAETKQLACLSCTPGRLPSGETRLHGPTNFSSKAGLLVGYYARQIFDDGRTFFTTPSSLVPQDTNGAKDVYEYLSGQSHLISSGTASGDSVFLDADPTGENVFFVTSQDLVPSDTDNGLSVYDARVDGGFNEPPPPPPCEGESCRGASSAGPNPLTPGSANFTGREEGPKHVRPAPCKGGFAKRHGKCVKKHEHKKRTHRKKQVKHGGSKRRSTK